MTHYFQHRTKFSQISSLQFWMTHYQDAPLFIQPLGLQLTGKWLDLRPDRSKITQIVFYNRKS